MHYEVLKLKYLNDYVSLILNQYNQLKETVALPHPEEVKTQVEHELKQLIKYGNGFTHLDGTKVIGFIGGYQVEALFGNTKGIYVPLTGHGIDPSDHYSSLYQHASAHWVKEGYLSHSITLFTNNEVIGEWFDLGFGKRCVDSISIVKPEEINSSYEIQPYHESMDLQPLLLEHQKHFHDSPLFMKTEPINPKTLTDAHLFVALDNQTPIGYMKLTKHAESFVSEASSVINITGAHVLNSYQNTGIGKALLNYVNNWALKNEYTYLGVDFESFNISGAHFWNKYFTPYTYSLTRRIDERILNDNHNEI